LFVTDSLVNSVDSNVGGLLYYLFSCCENFSVLVLVVLLLLHHIFLLHLLALLLLISGCDVLFILVSVDFLLFIRVIA
jgi:hypothetical protein